jgi:hypothetical protein
VPLFQLTDFLINGSPSARLQDCIAHANEPLDRALASAAIAITCKNHENYEVLSSDWPMSNPAGYAGWFEGRMSRVAVRRRQTLVAEGRYPAIERVPTYALKTPLQRSVQLLKRHRDVMFGDDEDKPISIIITTLTALAYQGEEGLYDALRNIVRRLPDFVREDVPRVPNPVNPGEDFADKWASNSALEENFWRWHTQVTQDIESLASVRDAARLQQFLLDKFAVRISEVDARDLVGGLPSGSSIVVAGGAPSVQVKSGPSPWARHA